MAVFVAMLRTAIFMLMAFCCSSVPCTGSESQWGSCNQDPCAGVCQARPCEFADWSHWADMGKCLGLCSRSRAPAQANNECGAPCNGTTYETKECPLADSCTPKTPVDCKYSDWADWTNCADGQTFSKRTEATPAAHLGKPCAGDTQRTRPCTVGGDHSLDCQFSDWTVWTKCSAECDGGSTTRERKVTQEAKPGGVGCHAVVKEVKTCHTHSCNGTSDCVLDDWTDWSSTCDAKTSYGPFQRDRKRSIKDAAKGGAGKPCVGGTYETKGCTPDPVPCEFADWKDWSKCTVTCGSGQKSRVRDLKSPAKNGGACPAGSTHETVGCDVGSCQTCHWSDWKEWSTCSTKCGEGVQLRERQGSGYNCDGPTKVVRNCSSACPSVDCKWADWADWSVCSLSCGGGTHTRARSVAISPSGDGAPCDNLTASEIGSCQNHTCPNDCVDGTLSDWTDWSQCSATCQTGEKKRERTVATQPNQCGAAASGNMVEIAACKSSIECVADRNCSLGDWSPWGDCETSSQQSCFGVSHRNRTIKTQASGFYGQPCMDSSLTEVKSCHPTSHGKSESCVTDVNCEYFPWSAWSNCSTQQSCGTGQKKKTRKIKTYPSGQGTPCNGDLSVTTSCAVQACEAPNCTDCLWETWSEWGKCQGGCHGQKMRHRSVIRPGNWCGKPCGALNNSMETAACTGDCDEGEAYCAWTEWSVIESCPPDNSTDCGPRTQRKRRIMKTFPHAPASGYIVKGTSAMPCTGDDVQAEACPMKKCHPTPIDCSFKDWSAWSTATCNSLCTRNRDVAVANQNGGKPCAGDLSESKICTAPANCSHPQDCALSDWGVWSTCSSFQAQKTRDREIVFPAKNGGIGCNGTLQETKWCTDLPTPKDCVVTSWSDWSHCTQSCDGGTRLRKRAIQQQPERFGIPCVDDLEQMEGCGLASCPGDKVNCEFGDWRDWTPDLLTGQKQRARSIAKHAANGGLDCTGQLEEVHPLDPVDCDVDDWSGWGECDRSCGPGQQERKRQVLKHAQYNGRICNASLSLQEVRGCNGTETGCGNWAGNAKVSDWSEWTDCTATCKVGQHSRIRKIIDNRGFWGVGFSGALEQTRACPALANTSCGNTDCIWFDWSSWSMCDKTCGGGNTERSRHIRQAPAHGGAACKAMPSRELKPCGMGPCTPASSCVDGLWGDWSTWSTCTATCNGGTSLRHRRAVRFANFCGNPFNGTDREYRSCNAHVTCSETNCTLFDWNEWSSCNSKCDGVKKRDRKIKNHATGNGKVCNAELDQVRTCNPTETTDGCEKYVVKDCVFSDWSQSDCSTTCGNGTMTKTRIIKVPAQNAGKPCDGSTYGIFQCVGGDNPCPVPEKVDCKWKDWSDWGACSQCSGGERKRHREIVSPAFHGGKPCKAVENGNETQACNDATLCKRTYCIWASWADWGDCSKSCDGGKRERRRELFSSPTPASDDGSSSNSSKRLYDTYEELRRHVERKGNERWQELSFAFTGGCGIFFLAAVAFRYMRPRSQRDTSVYSLLGKQSLTQDAEEAIE